MMKTTLKWFGCVGTFLLLASCGTAADTDPALEGEGAEAVSQELRFRPIACASSAQCGPGGHCTTEDGVCNPPPGCVPGRICPAVCYGTCVFKPIILPPGGQCGTATCGKGEFCCNASCNTCAPIGGACTQQICSPTM